MYFQCVVAEREVRVLTFRYRLSCSFQYDTQGGSLNLEPMGPKYTEIDNRNLILPPHQSRLINDQTNL